jgi:hypothetical protein
MTTTFLPTRRPELCLCIIPQLKFDVVSSSRPGSSSSTRFPAVRAAVPPRVCSTGDQMEESPDRRISLS